MYYGQWEGVHRMTIGGPRLKKVGNRCFIQCQRNRVTKVLSALYTIYAIFIGLSNMG